MIETPASCLRLVQQRFAEELAVRSDSSEVTLDALQTVIGSAIEQCFDCPLRPSDAEAVASPDNSDPSQENGTGPLVHVGKADVTKEAAPDLTEREKILMMIVQDKGLWHMLYGSFTRGGYGYLHKQLLDTDTDSQKYHRCISIRREFNEKIRDARSYLSPLWPDVDNTGRFTAQYDVVQLEGGWVAHGIIYRDKYSGENRPSHLVDWDLRGGIVQYLIATPSNSPSNALLASDPTLMPDVFACMFPDCDRSEGSLIVEGQSEKEPVRYGLIRQAIEQVRHDDEPDTTHRTD